MDGESGRQLLMLQQMSMSTNAANGVVMPVLYSRRAIIRDPAHKGSPSLPTLWKTDKCIHLYARTS